jgi:hypothetical protein
VRALLQRPGQPDLGGRDSVGRRDREDRVVLVAVRAPLPRLTGDGEERHRVLTLQTGGIPETMPEGFAGREAIAKGIEGRTMLGRAAALADVGQVAVFAASDHARSMTATALNITCGSVVD